MRTIGFNLGTELWMSRQLALGAGVGVTHDTVAGRVGSGEFSLIYRF